MTDYERKAKKRLLDKINVDPQTACWNWLSSKTYSGYGMMFFRGRATLAHRISYSLHIGLIPDDLHVLHTCDNRSCVNPSHLFLGTHTDNMRDKVRKGRQPSKISAADVLIIRREHKEGTPKRVLASAFGLSREQVRDIVNRKRWEHVQ